MAYDPDNVFARILRSELPSDRVYEDAEFIAFRDIRPAAPTHVLIIPRQPITGAMVLTEDDAGWAGRMLVLAARIARDLGLDERGYRLVMNCGPDGGQEVPHMHLHILGGGRLGAFA